jgi:hypothetical protein
VAITAVVATVLAAGVVAVFVNRAAPAEGGVDPLTGSFVRWEPIDDGHGTAVISVTNAGSSAAAARCTVEVTTDLGGFGIAALTGEDVPPNATIIRRLVVNIGQGSYRVTGGKVTHC